MANICFVFKMPKNGYFGGIASIVEQYKIHRDLFEKKGIFVEHFDYYNVRAEKLLHLKIGHFIYAFCERKELKRYLKQSKTDIIHIHTSKKWLFLKDILLIRYIKKRIECKMVLSIHFADAKKILYNNVFIRKLEIRLLGKYADIVVFLSEKTLGEFKKLGLPSNSGRVLYTFHNFDNNIKKNQYNDDNIRHIIFMGSIDRRKGILDLLHALNDLKHENYILHVCGAINDESVVDEYNRLSSKLGDKYIFEGYVTGEKKQALLQKSDMLILPSYGEGMPIVIMEAMACGCSIISTNIGAIPEIVKSESGVLVNPGDISALKEEISKRLADNRLIEKEKDYNSIYGRDFNLEENILKLCRLYDSLKTER